MLFGSIRRPAGGIARSGVTRVLISMKSKSHTNKTAPVTLENGQIWEMGESRLAIRLVGKRLVHYKHFTGTPAAAPVHLSGKADLEKLLRKHGAVLLPPAAAAASGRAGRSPARRGACAPRGGNS